MKRRVRYIMLDGTTVSLRGLTAVQLEFIDDLKKMLRAGVSYFELERAAIGHDSLAVGGAFMIGIETVRSPLYLVASDIAHRAGVKQGLLLKPADEDELDRIRRDDGPVLSVANAAELIGISRAAVYKAIEKGSLPAVKIGGFTLVKQSAAKAYRKRRAA